MDGSTGQVTGLTLAPDGAIWYSKNTSHRMGRIPAGGGKGVEYELPAPNVFTSAIAAGADGRIWYVDPVVNKVGYITGDGNVITYDAPSVNGTPLDPAGIAVAADGSVWVTSVGLNAVFRVDPASGAFHALRYRNAERAARCDYAADRTATCGLTCVRSARSGVSRPPERLPNTRRASSASTRSHSDPMAQYGIARIKMSGVSIRRPGASKTFACAGGGGMTIGPDKRLWCGARLGQRSDV